MEPKLALGTVQFGLPYGITNKNGQPALTQIVEILKACRNYNPSMILDTAASYGDSEAILGKAFEIMEDQDFRVVTKTDPKDTDIIGRTEKSLNKLGLKKVYGLLDHNAMHLLGPEGQGSYAQMQTLKSDGRVSKIGASLYSAKEVDLVLDSFDIDIVQIPLNVFDQRLVESGHLKKLQQRGVEIHVRSVFLQGVLLADPGSLPPVLQAYQPVLSLWERACNLEGISKVAAALAYVRSLSEVDAIIVGVNTIDEWQENFAAGEAEVDLNWGEWASDDVQLLNPALWANG